MAEAQLTNQFTRIDSMTNAELRTELKKRGCSTSGNKKDLIVKLRAALEREYGRHPIDTSLTSPVAGSINADGRKSRTSVNQSLVAPSDGDQSVLDDSTASSNVYMTPQAGSPSIRSSNVQTGGVPIVHNKLQEHEQELERHPPGYNTNVNQNIHDLSVSTKETSQAIKANVNERNQLQHSTQATHVEPQTTPMSTRSRSSMDGNVHPSVSPVVSTPSPEKRTRGRAKKVSVDSQPQEIQETVEHQPKPTESQPQTSENQQEHIENPVNEVQTNPLIDSSAVQEAKPEDSAVHNTSSNTNNENNVEVNSFVSKSNEDDQRDVGEERGERGESRSPSVGSSSAKSESVIKEIPLSGDRHRLSRSKSPKSRWHHSPSPRESEHQTNQISTIDEENSSASKTNDGDEKNSDKQIEKPSDDVKVAEKEKIDSNQHEEEKKEIEQTQKQDQNGTSKHEEEESKVHENSSTEKVSDPNQQIKISRTQTSASSNSSTTLMKGSNRSTSHRMNLSSDILKTLIPDISLAPESIIESELDASNTDLNNDERMDDSPSQVVLETNPGNNALLNESSNVGEVTEQKQRNRTVVIDLAVDSSSLNDDLLRSNSQTKKISTGQAPLRVASFESKILLDGKTNALMMDEPVRVTDASVAREPATRIVYIVGLTRPFTPAQLKELLSRYGTLTDDVWLDKIKSQCFAMYNTLEEAQTAREALDGCRWPSTNPKTLKVRFGGQEEFDFSKTHDLPPDKMRTDSNNNTSDERQVTEKPSTTNKQLVGTRRSTSPSDETRQNNKKARQVVSGEVREWDLPKLQPDKEKSTIEREVIEEAPAKNKEPPAKELDDYFRKTKAKPAIYWLPLSEEQAIEKAQQKEKKKAEEQERRKRVTEQNTRETNYSKDSKSRSNNNGNSSSYAKNRRSPSPKDKRKRVSSSSSPPRRENKRH